MKAFSLFKCRDSSGKWCELNPDPPLAEEARMFQVTVRTVGKINSWVPISSIVFARDELHAESRIRAALAQTAVEHPVDAHLNVNSAKRAQRIIAGLRSGNMSLTVAPADVASLAYMFNWSLGGGI